MVRSRLFANPLRSPLLISCALHAVALLALALHPRAAPEDEPGAPSWAEQGPGRPVEVAVIAPAARLAPREAQAAAAGGRPPGVRVRHAAARTAGTAASAAPPASLAADEATVAVDEAAVAELPVTIAAPAPSSPAELPAASDDGVSADGPPGAGGEGRGTGDGTGNGAGSGSGDGIGEGTENLGKELHARILGDVAVDLPGDDQHRTVLTHEQATTLRQRDIFPRLPESLWPAWRPYVVTLRVCVDEQGQVSDATLLSSAAPRLDRMVAAAARSWQYRPFHAMGHATAFCHAVVIQYEHW